MEIKITENSVKLKGLTEDYRELVDAAQDIRNTVAFLDAFGGVKPNLEPQAYRRLKESMALLDGFLQSDREAQGL